MEQLTFSQSYEYDTLLIGITVPVNLHFGLERIQLKAKIDSGSTHCIFERQHAERLGITVENGILERFGTAVGGFPAYGHELAFSVLGIELFSIIYFAAEDNFTKNVLGQNGFLDRVKFGLVDYEGKLFLDPYTE